MIGDKPHTEALECPALLREIGRGAFQYQRSRGVSLGGGSGSENADMSSANAEEVRVAVSPRFPGEGSSSQVQSDPKSKPYGVDDGKQVNIPAPPKFNPELLLRTGAGRRVRSFRKKNATGSPVANSPNHAIKKKPVYTKVSVP